MAYSDEMPQEDEFDYGEDMGDGQEAEKTLSVLQMVEMDNIALELEDQELSQIGIRITEDFDRDFESMSEWREQYGRAMKLAKLTAEEKSYPWPNAANIKYPLISNAAIKFSARAYPEIVRGDKVVKFKAFGKDIDNDRHIRGERIAEFMNFQLLSEMEEWDSDMDRLLTMLPIVGQLYKKVYYSPLLRRNVSELVRGDDVILNIDSKSWEATRRMSHYYRLHNNDIKERQNAGLFVEKDIRADDVDEDLFDIIEQHCWLDLDKDGYEEPYIVTVHEASNTVLRIKARYSLDDILIGNNKVVRINPIIHFTPYGFIPAFDGSILCIGFGALLECLNESANTIINQLLDAGTLSNMQSGMISKGIRIAGGEMSFEPGEWKFVDTGGGMLKDSIFPLPIREPSPVLFQMLGLILDAANEIAAVKDVLSGDSPGANTSPTTILALIEQGQKTFNSIYKRIYHSLQKELRMLYRLNAEFADPRLYQAVLEDPQADVKADFQQANLGVMPVADPILSSQAHRVAMAQAAMQMSGRPGVNEEYLTRSYFEAIGHPDMSKVMLEKKGPDAATMLQLTNLAKEKDLLEIKKREIAMQERESKAKVMERISAAMLSLSKARTEFGLGNTRQFDEELTALEKLMSEQSEEGGDAAIEMQPNEQQTEQPPEQMNEAEQPSDQEAMAGMEGEPSNSIVDGGGEPLPEGAMQPPAGGVSPDSM